MKGRTIACRAGSLCWMRYTAAKLYRSAKQERSFKVAIPAASSGGLSVVVLSGRAGGYQRPHSARAGGNEARRDCDRLGRDCALVAVTRGAISWRPRHSAHPGPIVPPRVQSAMRSSVAGERQTLQIRPSVGWTTEAFAASMSAWFCGVNMWQSRRRTREERLIN